MSSETYTECSEALRHYSVAISNLRTITIGQGFAILTAQGYLITENVPNKALHLAAAIFGMMLIVVLYSFQWNYKFHFDAILPIAVVIEKKIDPNQIGPWGAYSNAKGKKSFHRLVRLASLHGIYCLFLLAELGFYLVGLF